MPDDSNLPAGNPFAGEPPLEVPPTPGSPENGTGAGADGVGAMGAPQGSADGRPPKPTQSAGVGHHWAWSEEAKDWLSTPNFRRKAAAKPKRSVPPAAAALAAQLGMGRGGDTAPNDGQAPSPEPPADGGVFVFNESDNRAFLAYVVEELENTDKERLVAMAEAALVGTKHANFAKSIGERFWSAITTRPNEREAIIAALLDVLRDMEVNIPPSASVAATLVMAGVRRVKGYKDFSKELAELKNAA